MDFWTEGRGCPTARTGSGLYGLTLGHVQSDATPRRLGEAAAGHSPIVDRVGSAIMAKGFGPSLQEQAVRRPTFEAYETVPNAASTAE